MGKPISWSSPPASGFKTYKITRDFVEVYGIHSGADLWRTTEREFQEAQYQGARFTGGEVVSPGAEIF